MATDITLRQQFGPAMTALSEMQRNFVIAHCNAGGKNATESARAAGYSDKEALRTNANRVLHSPKVQAAIRELMQARLSGNLPALIDEVEWMAKERGHSKQLDAIRFAAHHAGMIEKHQVDVTHTHILTIEEKKERLAQLSASLGRLDDDQPVIDAVAVEIDPTDPEYW